jgi:N-sulfoglucosamine sulfohydrolase
MKNICIKSFIALSPVILSQCGSTGKENTSNERPNILIAMGDDISFPNMSAYGSTFVKTPGFDRIAREGILFNNLYTPNAKSAPSRACFLTGRNSWQLEEAANHVPFFPQKFTTFIESLKCHEYNVGFTQKGWAPGIAVDNEGKPRELTGKAFNVRKTTPPTSGISNNDYAANFSDFLAAREPDKPFCFWYGSVEPHRGYEYGSGASKGGKKISEIMNVYKFWPDNDTVRNDLLDYAFEIEYFDAQLVKMLEMLEENGELSNTIVIVTGDNGMPFPRIKGQSYEYSNHLPMAIMWGKGIKNPGRTIDDFVNFIDIAPTLLETAGISESESGMQAIEGKSLTDIFKSKKSGIIDPNRDHILIGKERHDVGRPDDQGYPIRGIIKDGYLYIRNFKTERWPSGNPETGYLNCDGGATKSFILNMRRKGISQQYWDLCFGKRVDEELYNIAEDRDCIKNLAVDQSFYALKQKLRGQLEQELKEQGDPRILGNGDVFDKYPYAQENTSDFYNRYMKGELTTKNAGWVNPSDFESKPIN